MASKIITSRGILKSSHALVVEPSYSASVLWGVIGLKKFQWIISSISMVFYDWAFNYIPCITITNEDQENMSNIFEPSIVIGGFLKYSPYNLSYYIPGLYVSYMFMSHGKKL